MADDAKSLRDGRGVGCLVPTTTGAGHFVLSSDDPSSVVVPLRRCIFQGKNVKTSACRARFVLGRRFLVGLRRSEGRCAMGLLSDDQPVRVWSYTKSHGPFECHRETRRSKTLDGFVIDGQTANTFFHNDYTKKETDALQARL